MSPARFWPVAISITFNPRHLLLGKMTIFQVHNIGTHIYREGYE
jgi:hypothetical protein